MLHENISANAAGHLTFAGYDVIDLAREYDTPLYLLDEAMIRGNCRMYRDTMARCMSSGSGPLYASKALSFAGMYAIMAEENMGIDVVSPGELYTALRAGFPAERIYFHGNNKTDEDIRFAVDNGIGYFIVDNREELEAVSAYAGGKGLRQKILIRVTPGIDPHTFAAVNTGRIDCQFGQPLATGQALAFTGEALKTQGVELCGFHCHIGSQIFDWVPFGDAADLMLDFIAQVKSAYGYEAGTLNLGGGFGVRYTEADPQIDIPANIERLGAHIESGCSLRGLTVPQILMEPGRSIVAASGMTVYTVGSVKTIEGYKNYVSIDGGMSDNPRYALYQSPYTVVHGERPEAEADFRCTVAGRCCESGALIQENVMLSRPVRGEHVAVFVTGAYNYSMASNYNRICRPAVVMLGADGPRIAVRRETYADLVKCDVF